MSFVKAKIKQIKEKFRVLNFFWNDYCDFLDVRKNITTRDGLSANIMLTMHSLEKGLSFTENAREFGKDKADRLCKLLRAYITEFGNDKMTKIGLNVLSTYVQSEFATSDSKVREQITELLSNNSSLIEPNYAGVKEVQKPHSFNIRYIEEFYESRNSVRDFDKRPLSDLDIKNVLQFATHTPSACNRQANKVYVVRDSNLIAQLMDLQLGDQGWCRNASTLFVITTNRSFFASEIERYQGYIDGGLYAMNFVMGLHAHQIASCFKMYIRDPKLEKKFKKTVGIPQVESPVILILAGYYKETSCLSPMSVRLDASVIEK